MESGKFLREAIERALGTKFKNLSELAKRAKVSQGNLSSFMNPEGRKSMAFDTAWKILTVLDVHITPGAYTSPDMHSPDVHTSPNVHTSPDRNVHNADLEGIPVHHHTTAGDVTDFFDSEPDTYLPVPKQYRLPNVRALLVTGDSMEPTIRCGAHVGVVPMESDLHEGGIYLVRIPDFGLVIKRVRLDGLRGITLYSDNKEYPPLPLPFNGHKDIIIGKVAWVWQLFQGSAD